MLRFIIRREVFCAIDGRKQSDHFTTTDVNELERSMRRGGYGESGYEFCELIGCEVIDEKEEK